MPVALDVTDHARVAAIAAELGDVSIVINNAGIGLGATAVGGDDLADHRARRATCGRADVARPVPSAA